MFRRTNLYQRSLISQLKCHLLDKILFLLSGGLSSLVVFQDDALNVLSLVSDDDDHRETEAIDSLAKAIANEVSQIKHGQSHHIIRTTSMTCSNLLARH